MNLLGGLSPEMSTAQDEIDHEQDRQHFQARARYCLSDARIVGYFNRGLVERPDILAMLATDDVFEQATQIASYITYAELRRKVAAKTKRRLDVRLLVRRLSDASSSFINGSRVAKALHGWLEACEKEVIIPNAILSINTKLGAYQGELLVEQDSEGLRRLLDPTFRVSTRSEHKLDSAISEMDGGSIALAGPRGVGKSTLLRHFCEVGSQDQGRPGVYVYVPAPAEYIARDFIAELFRGLCQAYLAFCNYSGSDALYAAGRPKGWMRRAIHNLASLSWLSLRTAIAISLVVLASWPLITKVPRALMVALGRLDHWITSAPDSVRTSITEHRPYWVVGAIVLAWILAWH